MIHVATVVGARPQFVKAAPTSRAIAALPGLRETLVHTGQHFDHRMSEVFFEELGLPRPDHHLGISGGGHGAMTGAMLQALEPLLETLGPDWVLVYGDTNSTLAGALAAVKLHIPTAHVEAGLRSFNRRMPEEVNRVLVDHLSERLFCPTDAAVANLQREGIGAGRVLQTGDTMFDALRIFSQSSASRDGPLERLGLERGNYVLATIHRAENTDDPHRLRLILDGLEQVAAQIPVVLPIHPRTRRAAERLTIGRRRVLTIEAIGYLDMLALERGAAAIATDSGGVQKEAYFHRVPCVTLRDETEWTELVDLGWNRLAPPGRSELAAQILGAIGSAGRDAPLYGDGFAAERIALALRDGGGGTAER
jgi:UDP-GlcNAc3NAcA epimerase